MTERLGVYFGLAEAAYHADEALGSHDVIELATLAAEWQWNRLGYGKERADTPSQRWGAAFHALILDGEDVFRARHPVMSVKDDYPDLLETVDDINRFIAEHGITVNIGARKATKIAAIRQGGYSVPIWDEIKAAAPAGEPITREQHDEIVRAAAFVTKHPQLGPAFEKGCPEVSVFWRRKDGIRCKARIDYLKLGSTVDLKSLRTWAQKTLDRAISQSIANYRYDIQAAHYREARDQIRGFVERGMIHGECPRGMRWLERASLRAWTDDTSDPDGWLWVWVFFKAEGAPVAVGHIAARDVLEKGEAGRQVGFDAYRANCEKFGEDEVWIVDQPLTFINCDQLPKWMEFQ